MSGVSSGAVLSSIAETEEVYASEVSTNRLASIAYRVSPAALRVLTASVSCSDYVRGRAKLPNASSSPSHRTRTTASSTCRVRGASGGEFTPSLLSAVVFHHSNLTVSTPDNLSLLLPWHTRLHTPNPPPTDAAQRPPPAQHERPPAPGYPRAESQFQPQQQQQQQ